MAASFVQVPPQSTGKKVATVARTEINYDGASGTPFSVGDEITSAGGATGTITGIVTEGFASGSGQLYLKDISGTFVDNETIAIDPSPSTVAFANLITDPQVDFEMQKITLADPENPDNMQRIDRFGATLNSFTDGSPVFGPYGTITVGEPQTIKEYRFAYDKRSSDWYEANTAGATIEYESTTGAIVLQTGTTSGQSAQRTTHFYHPYVPGSGQLVEMTMSMSDTGKANVRRRWGYFDDNNGIYFELNGTTLNAVIRSNVSGTISNTEIASTDFNGDKLDGSDAIGFTIDVTKGNIYWIDFQWGAGRVRMGVIEPSGSKVIAHTFENANINTDFPYMRTATLPMRIEQTNTGTAGSTSEMRMISGIVNHTSEVKILGDQMSIDSSFVHLANTAGEVPLIALRPRTTFNGFSNHSIVKFVSMSLTNSQKIATPAQAPIRFKLYGTLSSLLTGGTWANLDTTNSTVQYNTTATSLGPAKQIFSYIVPSGETQWIRAESVRDIHFFELYLDADETTQRTFVLTAECLNANAYVSAAINWEEIIL